MTEKVITIDTMCQAVTPILISRRDVLTTETAEMIGDHNNVLWCACEHLRPASFDATAVCGEG